MNTETPNIDWAHIAQVETEKCEKLRKSVFSLKANGGDVINKLVTFHEKRAQEALEKAKLKR